MAILGIEGISLGDMSSHFKTSPLIKEEKTESFSSVLSSMMNSIDETNSLQNKAEEEEIQFALGESENTHDLLIAQIKATVALQYTVAVRDKMIDAYKELMQMSV